MRKTIVGLCLVFLVSACGGKIPLQNAPGLTVVEGLNALPPPERADLVAADRPALVGPLDSIKVDVFNVPELTRDLQVDASGYIAMPLIGSIDARGKTAGELARFIETKLRDRFVKNPDVTVNIKSSVSQVVTVDGQVTEPGLYPVTNQSTMLRAIASAKGLAEFADPKDIVILRTVGGQRMAALYNIEAIRRGIYPDPVIYANDEIIVGDSPRSRALKTLIQVTPALAAPLVAVFQRL
ncbi:MAG: polysaccharide export protein [Sphingomonas sp.]|uniref:polysaccharide biosynthesis/export family protein n=1 Tax=Sphingomonas sp. TaxID=28214 RepID=UPI0025CC3BEC|nr:polysaccharide biosynthesis/export family protein [Sphingomonas sp.]MBY0284869.1 polysaccharide export protein [Sphingomonas sp.]